MTEKVSLPKGGAEFVKAAELALEYNPIIDPPPWILRVLDEDMLKKIYQIKLVELAEIAEAEGKMFRKISEIMQ